jgi:sigma-B regulation protein RsbU (phosphoserine phosphatase)
VTQVACVGPLLGVLEDVKYDDVEVPLRSEDLLLLYTDGVPEGRSGGDFYGEDRLVRVVGEISGTAGQTTAALLTDVLGFQGGVTRDDIAIVALRVPAE